MHPIVLQEFRRIIRGLKISGSVLEVGARPNRLSLIAVEELASCTRTGINLEPASEFRGAKILQGDANDMREFDDNSFDAVLSNATMEHDPRFWLACAEMRRVLKPGGVAIIGVPGFAHAANMLDLGMPTDTGNPARDFENATLTFIYHGEPHDYYRFSAPAIREVFFAGYEKVEVSAVMIPPRLIGFGYKTG